MSALILDTSTDRLHIGLIHQGSLIAWEGTPHENKLSHFLEPSIEALLQAHALSLKNLSYIDVLGYAFARKNNFIFLTGDRAFSKFEGAEIER